MTREYKLFEDGTDYFVINSLGTVPFLTLDDFSLKEAPAILQFIADSVYYFFFNFLTILSFLNSLFILTFL